jgi:hypothetical protein
MGLFQLDGKPFYPKKELWFSIAGKYTVEEAAHHLPVQWGF